MVEWWDMTAATSQHTLNKTGPLCTKSQIMLLHLIRHQHLCTNRGIMSMTWLILTKPSIPGSVVLIKELRREYTCGGASMFQITYIRIHHITISLLNVQTHLWHIEIRIYLDNQCHMPICTVTLPPISTKVLITIIQWRQEAGHRLQHFITRTRKYHLTTEARTGTTI